ncbi:MAG: pyrroline-5-carboxylate reductase [Deltaproteobacteria bacterium]|nr:pyrroline-5-carboxylate reductase [Deltaproteobacteria bacterium]
MSLGRVAVIGAGKMGETLIRAMVGSGAVPAEQIVATGRKELRLDALSRELHIETTLDNRQAVRDADLLLLCVKPQGAAKVLAELREEITADKLLVSILAGVPTKRLEESLLSGVPVVRAMPNTPSLLGEGMTALCAGASADQAQVERARRIFERVGRTLVLDEKHFDAVTGLSASGPAFIYIVIEALAEGGVKVGLPRQVATELAAQTCLGAAKMVIETDHHPAVLKDAVTTPAGCTIDGILKLEEGGLRVTLIKAIVEAARRSQELLE